MGAGSFGAGIGPAGFDPLTETPPEILTLPPGVRYDPGARTFPFGTDGGIEAAHPVDQYVALVCTIARGSLAACPDAGIDLDRIRKAPADTVQAVVTDEVHRALADGIARGDLLFTGAPILETGDELQWAVHYVNLRLPGQPARRFEGSP